MKDLHKVLLRAINEQIRPTHLLAHLLVAKLTQKGIDRASLKLGKIGAAVQEALSTRGQHIPSCLSIETGNPELDKQDIDIEIGKVDIDALVKATQRTIEKITPKLAVTLSKLLLRTVKHNAKDGLNARRAEQGSFETRLYTRWKKPLDLLAVQMVLGTEIGEERNRSLRKTSRRKDNFLVEVLTRLHARACQVVGEVETLLSSGYADGALARWRTLHEICVVSWFIRDKGNECAERYLSHTAVGSLRAANQYNEFAPIFNYEKIPAREVEEMKKEVQRLTRRYGELFAKEYGWASEALGRRDVRFADIERSVGLGRLRPYYKLASHNIHGGPEGAMLRLGLLATDESMLLAGPTNSGLDEAGKLTAISFSQITMNLLLFKPSFDSLVWSRVMLVLSRNVERMFVDAQLRLERETSKSSPRKHKKRDLLRR